MSQNLLLLRIGQIPKNESADYTTNLHELNAVMKHGAKIVSVTGLGSSNENGILSARALVVLDGAPKA